MNNPLLILQTLDRQGLFREDLYYRLAVLTVDLPPLRAREGGTCMDMSKTQLHPGPAVVCIAKCGEKKATRRSAMCCCNGVSASGADMCSISALRISACALDSPCFPGQIGLRRVETVAATLRAMGVDPATLETRSHGQDDPLVPTGPGVDEPRNRRVEIAVR